jgi:hypothetical protein
MLHQKSDGITAFATTKTLIDFLGWGNSKRRGLLVMEGAIAQIIGTSLL